MSNQELLNLFTKIFGSLNLVLIFASLFFNLLLLYTCLQSKKLRSSSTFKLIAFGSVNDILVCLAWNFEDFTDSFFSWQPYNLSLVYCRWISVLLQYSSISFTSWLLVSVSLDRLLSMIIKKWSAICFIGPRPVIYSAVLAFIILFVYSNTLFTIGVKFNQNDTYDQIICFISANEEIDWYQINSQVNAYLDFFKSSF